MSITKIKNALICGAIMTAAVFMIGCGDSDDDKKSQVPAGSGGNVVTEEGEAWVTSEEGETFGYIFKSNGTSLLIVNVYGMWFEGEYGTYSTNGGRLTMTLDGEDVVIGYSASGNTLTFHDPDGDDDIVFTKESGITVNSLSKSKQPLTKESKPYKIIKKIGWMSNVQ